MARKNFPHAEEPAKGGRLEARTTSIQAKRGSAITAAVALGGNLGDVAAAFIAALDFFAADPLCKITARSSVFRTPPWGKTDQPDFLNMAVLLSTAHPPHDLLALCQSIETLLGRERHETWGPRTLDIDLLTYGDVRIDAQGLILPHPRMTGRAFVLVPLAEIAPDLRIGGATIAEMLGRVGAGGISVDVAATERIRLIR